MKEKSIAPANSAVSTKWKYCNHLIVNKNSCFKHSLPPLSQSRLPPQPPFPRPAGFGKKIQLSHLRPLRDAKVKIQDVAHAAKREAVTGTMHQIPSLAWNHLCSGTDCVGAKALGGVFDSGVCFVVSEGSLKKNTKKKKNKKVSPCIFISSILTITDTKPRRHRRRIIEFNTSKCPDPSSRGFRQTPL